jgi:hypothetical protein
MIVFRSILASLLLFSRITTGEVPAIRVDAEGFNSPGEDITKICQSAASELTRGWKKLPEVKVLVAHGEHGPIMLDQRNDQGETVVRLDTEGTYWAQYAYQFAHELCHVMATGQKRERKHLWFEETLCEAASLYCLRKMDTTWRADAPYPNWRSFAPNLGDYARKVMLGREYYAGIIKSGLPAFYQVHRERLETEPCDRELNGAMAIILLGRFENEPEHWEAVKWLNATPMGEDQSFAAHMKRWKDAVPEEHREFVTGLAALYGFDI